MAKELPYFKFFVSEWNDGDITLEDYEVQGLFINLCSYYWSNECDLQFAKTKKKFKDAPEDSWKTLLKSNIIKNDDGNLVITFLDEQQEERLQQSKVKSKGGKASAEARRLKKLAEQEQQEINRNSTESQHVLNSCSTESQLLREEKIREDNIYTKENFLENWNQLRSHYLKTPSNLNKLYREESDSFNDLENDTTKEQYHKALHGLFKQEKVPADVMWFRPKHFLNNIDTYLDAELNKKYNLYV